MLAFSDSLRENCMLKVKFETAIENEIRLNENVLHENEIIVHSNETEVR